MSKGNSAFELEGCLVHEALIIVSTTLCYGYNRRCGFIPTGGTIFLQHNFPKQPNLGHTRNILPRQGEHEIAQLLFVVVAGTSGLTSKT